MGYRMNGFSGFGNSPAKQQDALEKKLVSQEFDTEKSENKLDGNKTSTQDDIIKFPDKEKTSPVLQKRVPKSTNIDKGMEKATKFEGTKTLTKKFHPRDYQKKNFPVRKERNEKALKDWIDAADSFETIKVDPNKKLPSSSNLDPRKK